MALNKRSPRPEVHPGEISPGAIAVWEGIFRRYADDIYRPKKASKQWVIAVQKFIAACNKKKIEPYMSGVRRHHKVIKAFKSLLRLLIGKHHDWTDIEFVDDFNEPCVKMKYKKDKARITVSLRTKPSVTAQYFDDEGIKYKKSFGRKRADEENLPAQFDAALHWLEGT